MILTAAYHIISTGEEWNPSDLQSVEMPKEIKIKLAKSDLQKSIKTLIANGITLEEISKVYLST